LLYSIFCISGSLATHLRYGGKYNEGLYANLLSSTAMKVFWKSVNKCQSYASDESGTFCSTKSVPRSMQWL